MHFKPTLVLLLLSTAFALPESTAEPIADPIPGVQATFKEPQGVTVSPRDEAGSLVARDCLYTTGCVSKSGVTAARYCGFCTQVRGTYNPTDLYQVNGGSGSSSCCDFGFSTSCSTHWPSVSPE
ncbi:hypothetical protein CJF32_00001972 [Rutstroemia sp. NJR-2017a WRK4]|nr:hypothetical protein CJF32_00001972 [Rutstroemia sp. NJR-2017a WRK4]